jgi:hypothetical protein
MLIRKRVRSLDAHLARFKNNEPVYVALIDTAAHLQTLSEVGFTLPLIEGEQLLPPAAAGIASKRNADGEEIVHRDQPLETHYRLKEWTWEEFRGRYDKVERSKIVETPCKRYPRTVIPPCAVELKVRMNKSGLPLVVAGPLQHNDESLLNTVHMFVELFGECELIGQDLTQLAQPHQIKRLNWEVLPPGKYPWSRAKAEVARVVSLAKPFDHAVLEARYREITAYEPDFIAIGRNGFARYVVYGWDARQLYVLESTEVDNATYVIKSHWETVSAMTKAEVLATSAHHARLIHRNSWFKDLQALMRNEGIGVPQSTPFALKPRGRR